VQFHRNETHSLGVELELQLVDRDTAQLCSSFDTLIHHLPLDNRRLIKSELMQSYLEINTEVCADVGEVEQDLTKKCRMVEEAAAQAGLSLIWAATHPVSSWQDQKITSDQRYDLLVDLMQDVARRLVTFGMHVHVGVDSGDKAIMIIDRLMRHLPLLLALTANSPFWSGRLTGLHSYRTKIMETLPTAGLPPVMRNWSEYVWLIHHLTETGFIHTVREIWWDVRPHHRFGTVEVRIMDMPCSLDHALAITALVQCLVAGISAQIDRGTYQTDCHPMLAAQNKWRACRFGLQANLVDPDTWKTQPACQMARRLVEIFKEQAQTLRCENYLEGVLDIIEHGNGAAYQLAVYHETHSPQTVAHRLAHHGTR